MKPLAVEFHLQNNFSLSSTCVQNTASSSTFTNLRPPPQLRLTAASINFSSDFFKSISLLALGHFYLA
jgi:hypothetical protein